MKTISNTILKYNLNFFGNITNQYQSHQIYIREPQSVCYL